MYRLFFSVTGCLFFFFLITGCTQSQEENDPSPAAALALTAEDLSMVAAVEPMVRGGLVSAEFLATVERSTTQLVFQYLVDIGMFDASLLGSTTYGVKSYQINYKTLDLQGHLLTASGLLTLPIKTVDAFSPLISYQHGSLFLEDQAPSYQFTHTSGSVLASSLGYIVAAADYLGYGASKGVSHPFSHSKTLASSGIDLLRAVKTFLARSGVQHNGELFLMGYSEGGKATLAMQREMETNLSTEFQISASVVGAGNYAMSQTMDTLLSGDQLLYPEYVGWVVKSYHEAYQLGDLSQMVAAPYVSVLTSSYDGLTTGKIVHDRLSMQTAEFFNPTFLAQYRSGATLAFKTALAENDDYDWKPLAPLYLFHGREDQVVPYFNSDKAYQTMLQRGASSVQLVACDAGLLPANHEHCYAPYVNYSYGILANYAHNL